MVLFCFIGWFGLRVGGFLALFLVWYFRLVICVMLIGFDCGLVWCFLIDLLFWWFWHESVAALVLLPVILVVWAGVWLYFRLPC